MTCAAVSKRVIWRMRMRLPLNPKRWLRNLHRWLHGSV